MPSGSRAVVESCSLEKELIMPLRANGNYVSFIESFSEIHGRFGDKVYRKRIMVSPGFIIMYISQNMTQLY